MTTQTARFFTERFKARNRLLAGVAIVLASAAPFAVGLIIITYLVDNPTGWLAAVVTSAAFLGAGGFTWLVQNRFALAGNAWLRESLQARVTEMPELEHCAGQPAFVGFGPGEDILIWDGETDLDVGFLCTAADALVYLGDRFSWSLSRDRIVRIELTPAPSGPRRIVIYWHAPRDPGRAFTLESRETDSVRKADTATVELFRGLRTWSMQEAAADRPPSPALGYPPTDRYGGHRVDQPASGWCATTAGMMVIIVLTIWYLAGEMISDGFYYHAILWAGFVFVGGTVFTRCLLSYLQTAGPHPRRRQPAPRA